VGVGGGVGLIALTENAGKRNEEKTNEQPCVECKSRKVVDCPICRGEGRDQFAEYVAGVKEAAGEEPVSTSTVTVSDWDAGEVQVEMYGDILSKFPVKVTGKGMCINCDGRGVVVCDNCNGSGIQPRFLERYSPDDFMD
jgi:DnaJ-class molecular chaperone